MNRVWPKVVITERNEIYRLCEDIYSQWAHELKIEKNILTSLLVKVNDGDNRYQCVCK